ncbi:MAG: carbon-nitrogen hydrolase family protein [Verrucomicrobiota bacterium]
MASPASSSAEPARRSRVYVCAGLVERAGDAIFNSALLIGPQGDLLLHHRKLNELALAHDLYALGDRLQVVRTPLATFGLMICADAFAAGQVITRTLGYMGADVILSPAAWAVPADHDNQADPYGRLWLDNYGPVARDFSLWIAGVSNVGWITGGPWNGRKCIGCSLVVGPSGQAVRQGPYGVDAEALLLVDIHPTARPAQGDRWAERWSDG